MTSIVRQSGTGPESPPSRVAVGLAVGRGTGPELADVFERVLGTLTATRPAGVEVVRSPRLYHSYVSLRAERNDGGIARIRQIGRAHV